MIFKFYLRSIEAVNYASFTINPHFYQFINTYLSDLIF